MPGSKPGALPLGDRPIEIQLSAVTRYRPLREKSIRSMAGEAGLMRGHKAHGKHAAGSAPQDGLQLSELLLVEVLGTSGQAEKCAAAAGKSGDEILSSA